MTNTCLTLKDSDSQKIDPDRIGVIASVLCAIHLTPPTMSLEHLRQWLLSLPRDILRIKGLARISDTEMAYFNRTDDPFESPRILTTNAQEGMEPAVVFIGPGLKKEFLSNSFSNLQTIPKFSLF